MDQVDLGVQSRPDSSAGRTTSRASSARSHAVSGQQGVGQQEIQVDLGAEGLHKGGAVQRGWDRPGERVCVVSHDCFRSPSTGGPVTATERQQSEKHLIADVLQSVKRLVQLASEDLRLDVPGPRPDSGLHPSNGRRKVRLVCPRQAGRNRLPFPQHRHRQPVVVLSRLVDQDDVEVDVHEVVVEHDGQGGNPDVLAHEERYLTSARSRKFRHPRDHSVHVIGSNIEAEVHVGELVRVTGRERSRHRHTYDSGISDSGSAGRFRLGSMSREPVERGRQGEVHG